MVKFARKKTLTTDTMVSQYFSDMYDGGTTTANLIGGLKQSKYLIEADIAAKPVYGDAVLDSLEFDFYHEGMLYKVPKQVGPMWLNLPFLDLEKDSTKLNKVTPYNPINRANKFVMTGDYSRELIISPLEGSVLKGGFQIQLNGEIAKNTFVNGV